MRTVTKKNIFSQSLILWLCFAGACKLNPGSEFFSSNSSSNPGKPTDESEGVVGYLVDPNQVELRSHSDGRQIEMSTPAQMVASDKVPLTDLVATVVTFDQPLNSSQDGNSAFSTDQSGTVLKSSRVADNGSFRTEFPPPDNSAVIVLILKESTPARVVRSADGKQNFRIFSAEDLRRARNIAPASTSDATLDPAQSLIAAFTGQLGEKPGQVSLNIDFVEAAAKDFSSVQIRHNANLIPPSPECADGGVVKELATQELIDGEFILSGLAVDKFHSFRACMTDTKGRTRSGQTITVNPDGVTLTALSEKTFQITIQPGPLTENDSLTEVVNPTQTHPDGNSNLWAANQNVVEMITGDSYLGIYGGYGFFGFNLGMIPVDAKITNAKAQLYQYDSVFTGGMTEWPLFLREVAPFNARTLSYSNQPAFTGKQFGSIVLTSATGWRTWGDKNGEFRQYLEERIRNSGKAYFTVENVALQTYWVAMMFHSGNQANTSLRPKLLIEYSSP